MTVRIITDTSCDLPPHLERELLDLGVQIVPFTFRFGLDECLDKSIPMRDFLARAKGIWPTTSVPSVGQFVEVFRPALADGHQVVCITITSNHSATYSVALSASEQFDPGQITVVDSRTLSLGQGLLVLAAARAAADGKNPEEIVATIDHLRRRMHLYITLNTVEYLVRGGRASRIIGLVVSLLKIRPMLTLADGELTMLDRARGREASKKRLLELAFDCLPAEQIGVAHIACEDEARDFVPMVAEALGAANEDVLFTETGMVIATHGGPGTLAVLVLSEG